MKQEKHEIRCSKIEKRLGKYCFFEKSYKNTRTKSKAEKAAHRYALVFSAFSVVSDSQSSAVTTGATQLSMASMSGV